MNTGYINSTKETSSDLWRHRKSMTSLHTLLYVHSWQDGCSRATFRIKIGAESYTERENRAIWPVNFTAYMRICVGHFVFSLSSFLWLTIGIGVWQKEKKAGTKGKMGRNRYRPLPDLSKKRPKPATNQNTVVSSTSKQLPGCSDKGGGTTQFGQGQGPVFPWRKPVSHSVQSVGGASCCSFDESTAAKRRDPENTNNSAKPRKGRKTRYRMPPPDGAHASDDDEYLWSECHHRVLVVVDVSTRREAAFFSCPPVWKCGLSVSFDSIFLSDL